MALLLDHTCEHVSLSYISNLGVVACRTVMVREGQVVEADTLSELGIFGYLVRRGDKVLHNKGAGHMMRTKVSCILILNIVTGPVIGWMPLPWWVCMRADLHDSQPPYDSSCGDIFSW